MRSNRARYRLRIIDCGKDNSNILEFCLDSTESAYPRDQIIVDMGAANVSAIRANEAILLVRTISWDLKVIQRRILWASLKGDVIIWREKRDALTRCSSGRLWETLFLMLRLRQHGPVENLPTISPSFLQVLGQSKAIFTELARPVRIAVFSVHSGPYGHELVVGHGWTHGIQGFYSGPRAM